MNWISDFAVYWDDDAKVWVAVGRYIKGLTLEAPTLELLGKKADGVIPELMAANNQAFRKLSENPEAELT